MKYKILFVFVSDEFLRNFHENKIFEKLKKIYDVKFILQKKDIYKFSYLKKNKDCLGLFDYSKKQIKQFNLLNWSNSIIKEKLSKTFKYQNNGIFLKTFFKYPNESIWNTIINFFPRIIIQVNKYRFFLILKFSRKNEHLKKKYLKDFKKKNYINSIKIYNPNLIIFPTRGNHPALFEISKYFKEKTLLMCDNWDNPSSKSYLDPKPKFISVWGNQSVEHAKKCNNFKNKNISILGTSKYENFFKKKNQNIKSHFDFKYILFLGSWIYDGLNETLKKLDEIISINSNLKNYKIVFRPHPFLAHNRKYDISQLKNIIVDPDIKIDKNSILYSKVVTNLNYYPSLIKNADLIICGPTTMVLESCIFYKKTILLGIDGKNFFNHKNTLNNMIHLKSLNKFPNLIINENLDDLNSQIQKIMKIKINKKLKKNINNHLNYYLTDNAKNYFYNFNKCIKRLIKLN